MGIRMLQCRRGRGRTRGQVHVEDTAPFPPPAPVPAFAVKASTARIPADLATALRRTATGVGAAVRGRKGKKGDLDVVDEGEASVWRVWVDLGLGYLALGLGLLPRARRLPGVTVFTTADDERAGGSARIPSPQEPRPDARF